MERRDKLTVTFIPGFEDIKNSEVRQDAEDRFYDIITEKVDDFLKDTYQIDCEDIEIDEDVMVSFSNVPSRDVLNYLGLFIQNCFEQSVKSAQASYDLEHIGSFKEGYGPKVADQYKLNIWNTYGK